MFVNYLTIALRNLWNNKSFTFINIFGLAVGMAISMLSLLYVAKEFSFDNFHTKKERIHRLIVKTESVDEGTNSTSVMTAGVGPSFLQAIPEIEAMVRVSMEGGFITFDDHNYEARSVVYADSSFFDVFSFRVLAGNSTTMLQDPFSMVLTKSMAKKLFADENEALGKIVRYNDVDNYLVTGLMEDPPINSHLRFDVLLSFVSLYEDPQMYLGWNGGWRYSTYFLLHENADMQHVEDQFVPIAEENINRENRKIGQSWNYFLQPLKKVHLNTNVDWDIDTHGSVTKLILLTVVALIILVIACINFINLTTAAALTRMKEVGVRKVAGADRRQIVYQFLTESMLVSLFAVVHAVIFVEIFYLWLSSQVGDNMFLENFELYNKSFYQLAIVIIFLIVTVGILAGAYPAIYMSHFKPALAVKGKIRLDRKNPVIRNLLVVFQFTISIILIICTLIIATQLDYLLKADKGFNPDKKIVISLSSESAWENVEGIKEGFLSIPGVAKAGASSAIPGKGYTRNGYFPEGYDNPLMFHALEVDYDYLEVMGLEFVQGRNFSKEFGRDEEAYIINQALARQLGWDHPVGKTIRRGNDHKIIGVVKDYNFSSLHNSIGPLIISLKPWKGYEYLTIQTAGRTNDIIPRLEKEWKAVVPYEDFKATDLNSYIIEAYTTEKAFMYMLLFCSFLTILIAALGLFGLAAFITRRRYKEIAIRKVFGAGMNRIFVLISTNFMKWILLANVIAWPLAYFIMNNYFLINFAYNGGIKWWIYLAALLFSGLIAIFVILFQILRLGRLNPVEYIRYE